MRGTGRGGGAPRQLRNDSASASSAPARSPACTRARTRTSATRVRVCTNVTQEKGRSVCGRAWRRIRRELRRCLPSIPRSISSTSARFRRSGSTPSAPVPQSGKPVQVQKPMSTTLETAREMIDIARRAGIVLGVVSQHRFDRASLFLSSAIRRWAARKAAAVRRLRQVVAIGRVLRAAGEGELGNGRRRSADQSGDPPGRSAAVVCRTRSRAVRHVADRRRPHDRIRGHRQCGDAIREWRDRRDSGGDGAMARLQRAH